MWLRTMALAFFQSIDDEQAQELPDQVMAMSHFSSLGVFAGLQEMEKVSPLDHFCHDSKHQE